MISRMVLLPLLLIFAGCSIPLFEHPLESPSTATVPAQLFGVYKQVRGPDTVVQYVHIGPAGDDVPAGVFRFVIISQPSDATTSLTTSRGYAIATRLGDYFVVQIPASSATSLSDGAGFDRDKWDESAILGYVLIRVKIKANRIEMSPIDYAFVATAIENGSLSGSVKIKVETHTVQVNIDGERRNETIHESKTESIRVTAAPDLLHAFIAENIDSALFLDRATTFKRSD
jgi:hypothetical protein